MQHLLENLLAPPALPAEQQLLALRRVRNSPKSMSLIPVPLKASRKKAAKKIFHHPNTSLYWASS